MIEALLAKLAWSEIKGPLLKAAPWIGCALAVLIGWHMVAVHYRQQGRAESAATIAGDRIAMQRGIEAIATVRGALDAKNAESIARAKAYEESKVEAAREVAAADDRWQRSEIARTALARAVGRKTGCSVAQDIIDAMEAL